MDTTSFSLTVNDFVKGTYMGVPFSGQVTRVETNSTLPGVEVKVDEPFQLYGGAKRKLVFVADDAPFSTIERVV